MIVIRGGLEKIATKYTHAQTSTKKSDNVLTDNAKMEHACAVRAGEEENATSSIFLAVAETV